MWGWSIYLLELQHIGRAVVGIDERLYALSPMVIPHSASGIPVAKAPME